MAIWERLSYLQWVGMFTLASLHHSVNCFNHHWLSLESHFANASFLFPFFQLIYNLSCSSCISPIFICFSVSIFPFFRYGNLHRYIRYSSMTLVKKHLQTTLTRLPTHTLSLTLFYINIIWEVSLCSSGCLKLRRLRCYVT